MFYIYVLYNKEHNKIYIGTTNCLERRVAEHNEKRGNHFTAKYSGRWVLIYHEEYQSKSEALKREKQLKSYRGREFIKTIISR